MDLKIGSKVWSNTPNIQIENLGGSLGFFGEIIGIDSSLYNFYTPRYKVSVNIELYPKYDAQYVWCYKVELREEKDIIYNLWV